MPIRRAAVARLIPLISCIAALGAPLTISAAHAQTLESIEVHARLHNHGTQATIRAIIVARPADATELPLTLLLRDDEQVTRAEAWLDDLAIPITFTSERPPLHRASVPLVTPTATRLLGGSASVRDAVTLRIEIDVSGAVVRGDGAGGDGTLTAHVPLPLPAWAPAGDSDSSFRATIETPAAGSLVSSFPTGLLRDSSSTPADGVQRFVASLPVPPAFLRLDLAQDPSWLRVAWLADGTAIACLLIGMAWAFLRLRQSRTFQASRDQESGSHGR